VCVVCVCVCVCVCVYLIMASCRLFMHANTLGNYTLNAAMLSCLNGIRFVIKGLNMRVYI